MSMFGKVRSMLGSKSERKLERKQKRQAKTSAAFGVNRAVRERDSFMEESQRRKLALNEQLAARGMSGGTHATEQREAFNRASTRALDTMGENITMAQQGQDVTSYGYKVQKRLKPLALLDQITGLAESALGAASGFGAVGSGVDGGGTEGMSFDYDD